MSKPDRERWLRLYRACPGSKGQKAHQASLVMRLLAHPDLPHRVQRPGFRSVFHERGDWTYPSEM